MRSVPVSIPSLLIMILLSFVLTEPAFSTSGSIPLDSDVYRHLDFLTAQGLLRTHLSGTRPLSWAEANRLLEEARERVKAIEERSSGVIGRSARLSIKYLEEEVYSRFIGDVRAGSGPLYAAFRDPELVLENLDGDHSSIPGIKAAQHALVYNNGGLDPDDGLTASILAEAEGAMGPLHLQFFPRLTTGEEDRSVIHRGSLKIGGLGGLELSVARESLWWGQGGHGGLYLTNNADPLGMIRLSTPHPTVLPWFLKHLGPFKFEMFVSRLEEDRAVPEPYLLGFRTNFRPVYELEIGTTLMIMTGGEGRPDITFGDLFDIIFGGNDEVDDRSNRIAGFDARLNLRGWQLYGEFGGEDEAGGLPSKMAGLLGIYYPDIGGNADLRFEYADFAYTEEIASAWYDHGAYTDGYTYNGRLLGHHVGGDGRDLMAEMTFPALKHGRGRVGLDIELRGIHLQPEVEQHTQIMAGWEGDITIGGLDCNLDISGAVDLVSNENYVSGEEATNGYFKVGVKGKI